MHLLISILIVLGSAAAVFWVVLVIVDRLQKGKKKNSGPLGGDDQSQNADIGGAPD